MFLIRKFIVKRVKPIGSDYKYKWKKKMAINVCNINYGFITNKWIKKALGRYKGDEKLAVITLSGIDQNNKIFVLYAIEMKELLLELMQDKEYAELWKLRDGYTKIKIE